MTKLELLKKLEYLIAFQADRLQTGDWESFDRAENEVKKIEEKLVQLNKS